MDYCARFIKLWNEGDFGSLTNIAEFTSDEKKWHEKQFDVFLKDLMAKPYDNQTNSPLNGKNTMLEILYGIFYQVLGYSKEQLDVILSEEMVQSTYHFVNAAKAFDPKMPFHNIFQACRNVWIMNGVQFLLGEEVCLTPPMFAYSMLYPYTDNYLDNTEIHPDEKIDFSKRFGRRLSGEFVSAKNENEEKIFRMVEIIEEYWNRSDYPKVYESLLAIHEAQVESIRLLDDGKEPDVEEILSICVQKGGTSVVADGTLILGSLNPEQEEFLYYYGAYLQLLDDLQDVGDDFNESLMTFFSASAQNQKLDGYANNVLEVGLKVMNLAETIPTGQVPVFKTLIKKSIDLFLVDSVFSNQQFYSKAYVREVEKYAPVSFSFIRKKKDNFSSVQDQLFDRIIQQATQKDNNYKLGFLHKKSLQQESLQAV